MDFVARCARTFAKDDGHITHARIVDSAKRARPGSAAADEAAVRAQADALRWAEFSGARRERDRIGVGASGREFRYACFMKGGIPLSEEKAVAIAKRVGARFIDWGRVRHGVGFRIVFDAPINSLNSQVFDGVARAFVELTGHSLEGRPLRQMSEEVYGAFVDPTFEDFEIWYDTQPESDVRYL